MDGSGPSKRAILAFLETITQLRPRLHRYCSRMTGSVMDGEDVMQDALFEAYRKLEQYDDAVHSHLAFPHRAQPLASTSYGGAESGLRLRLLPWVQIM